MQIINIDQQSKKNYITYIKNQLDFVLSGYSDLTIKAIFFSYGFRNGLAENSILQSKDFKPRAITQNFNHYKLPLALDPVNYGNIISINKLDSDNSLYIVQLENGNVFNIISKRINNLVINNVKLFRNGQLVTTNL